LVAQNKNIGGKKGNRTQINVSALQDKKDKANKNGSKRGKVEENFSFPYA
jgi:hypothetical protein